MKDWNAPALQELNVSLTAQGRCGSTSEGTDFSGMGGDYSTELIDNYPVDGDAGTKGKADS